MKLKKTGPDVYSFTVIGMKTWKRYANPWGVIRLQGTSLEPASCKPFPVIEPPFTWLPSRVCIPVSIAMKSTRAGNESQGHIGKKLKVALADYPNRLETRKLQYKAGLVDCCAGPDEFTKRWPKPAWDCSDAGERLVCCYQYGEWLCAIPL